MKLNRTEIGAWFAAAILTGTLLAFAPPSQAEPPLPALNIDLAQTTVSGISSGAFMAVQFAVAHSASVRGVAATAGGPYFCAGNDSWAGAGAGEAIAHCMQGDPAEPAHAITPADIAQMTAAARAWSSRGLIDDVANLSRQTIWLFHGYNDGVVKSAVGDALFNWYGGLVPASQLFYKNTLRAAHAQISADCGSGTSSCQACATTGGDFINACPDGASAAPLYDAAGVALQLFYGPLQRTPHQRLQGKVVAFDQRPYVRKGDSTVLPLKVAMADSGYLYVPDDCASGATCRLHVAFHGCGQQAEKIGTAFVIKSGFNEWADTNRIVVLYPQAVATVAPPLTPLNPNGCWDWWGYNDFSFDMPGHYATKDGAQIAAVWRMATALARGQDQPETPIGAASPALTVVDVSASQVALIWSAVAGATGYRVYRDGQLVGTGTPASKAWIDSGLAPQTTYRYSLRSIDAEGNEASPSLPVSATTAAAPPACDPYFSFSKGVVVTRKNVPTKKTCP